MSSAAERLAALKARVAAAVSGNAASGAAHTSSSQSHGFGNSSSGGGIERSAGLPPSGGLNVPLHPALENLSATTFTSSANKRKASHQGGRRGGGVSGAGNTVVNPYLDSTPAPHDENASGTTAPAPSSKAREPRRLQFNPKGKYIQQGNALRRQAALEAMKKRIAEQARKAGMDEIPSDKNFVIEEPPAMEWVDEAYFAEGKTYADLDLDPETEGGLSPALAVTGDDVVVTDLVQHPVPIAPPQDKLVPAPKPMFLTKQEQKKMRRQRRMAELKEKQAKIRLGLMPAPPPKVKRSNLMRVLGEEAVQDPTAVEARVNREIADRFQTHMQANEERKLTKEQRHEKLAANQSKDAAKGIHMLIFQIGSLANGQHRFKIWKNADQLSLTGVCIMHPQTNLVIVEGGQYSISKYRKLMMSRIDWTQNTPATMPQPQPTAVSANQTKPDRGAPAREWLANESESLPNNQIKLLFDGETKGRVFRKWSSKVCDTDREAFDFLTRSKLESFWAQARSGS